MDAPDHRPEPDRAPSTGPRRSDRSAPRSAVTSTTAADRLTVVAHELRNLLDGSIRCLGLAERSLAPREGDGADGDPARQRIETVRIALLRMTEIVQNAMHTHVLSSSAEGVMSRIELGEAIFHAVDVLTPLASDRDIRIKACVSNGLVGVSAGPLYAVIVNGLQNSIEAIASAGSDSNPEPGLIEVSASWTEDGRVRVAILDNGPGLPPGGPDAICRFGYSTKEGGSGIGLALAQSVVEELPEGGLSIGDRTDRPAGGRPGAAFEVTFRPSGADSSR